MTDGKPYVMSGEVGVPDEALTLKARDELRRQLTVPITQWGGEIEHMECFTERDGYVWVPRHFAQGSLWPRVTDWRWTEGESFRFNLSGTPDPERGQTTAIPAMIKFVEQNKGGILVSPTGTGKTFMCCHIAGSFGRYIGWMVYSGHMADNAIKHAKFALGLKEDQIGVVRGDRCDLGRPFTVLMIQSLMSRRYPDALYQQIGFLVADEIHRYGAPVWRTTVAMFPAKYRLGATATVERDDGADAMLPWIVGQIGHRVPRLRTRDIQPPTVIALKWFRSYPDSAYFSRARQGGYRPHPMRYDKLLARDRERNAMLAKELANAVKAGRSVLAFSRLRAHLGAVRKAFAAECRARGLIAQSGMLVGGLSDEDRQTQLSKQVIFTTYSMAREALDVPRLDTLFFLTPPGNAIQPVGRLREKSDVERKALLVVDCYEDVAYSIRKFRRRTAQFQSLGMPVKVLGRS